MSILVDIRQVYLEAAAAKKKPTGYPTGSRFGDCAAAMQILRQPDVVPREPLMRNLMTWEEGDRTEQWLGTILEKCYPNRVGLRQEPFYFQVPLPEDWMVDEVKCQIKGEGSRFGNLRLWGTVRETFNPPYIRMENGRIRTRLVANKRMGFVLDLSTRSIWVPSFVDFVIPHPSMGLTVVECKSMSNWSFRRAVMGSLDYKKQCQLVGLGESMKVNIALVAIRKETSHLAEIYYVRGIESTRIHITKSNGEQDVFFARGGQMEGAALPADGLWEQAEVWTPYNDRLVEDIQLRILRALFPTPGQWYREYGPAFLCQACVGKGEIVCKNCLGTGVGKTSTTGKQCGRCKGSLVQDCDKCEGAGTFDEVELSFPCSYCPVIGECYPFATLEIDSKPHYKITRAAWEESGLSFVTPGVYEPEDDD